MAIVLEQIGYRSVNRHAALRELGSHNQQVWRRYSGDQAPHDTGNVVLGGDHLYLYSQARETDES